MLLVIEPLRILKTPNHSRLFITSIVLWLVQACKPSRSMAKVSTPSPSCETTRVGASKDKLVSCRGVSINTRPNVNRGYIYIYIPQCSPPSKKSDPPPPPLPHTKKKKMHACVPCALEGLGLPYKCVCMCVHCANALANTRMYTHTHTSARVCV